jgi:hypothetical protein
MKAMLDGDSSKIVSLEIDKKKGVNTNGLLFRADRFPSLPFNTFLVSELKKGRKAEETRKPIQQHVFIMG